MLSLAPAACVPSAFPFPVIVGGQVLGVEAFSVHKYTELVSVEFNLNGYDVEAQNMDFCNVTVTHTHPEVNDTLLTQIWLPTNPPWNGRLKSVGGAGWNGGFIPYTFGGMTASMADGYAVMTTNGGLPSGQPADWALPEPGKVNLQLLEDFASISLNDSTFVAKTVIEDFYGRQPDYSYWSACSGGGRQGMMLAQRFLTLYNGIAAAAPAMNWPQLFVGPYFAQQLMNEMDSYPHACELDAITLAALSVCDGLDGLVDGYMARPDLCHFDPMTMVGLPSNCSVEGAPSTISKTAAIVAEAVWTGARDTKDKSLWFGAGPAANLTTAYVSVALTACSPNGTCTGTPLELFVDWLRLFIAKDADFELKTMTRRDFEDAFHSSVDEYSNIIGTNSPDLSKFRQAGGKILTYHGLSDEIIPFRSTSSYYDLVTKLDPNVHDFYRLFEAPGLGHCWTTYGAHPDRAFEVLVDWVENGIVPDTLEATSYDTKQRRLLCPYPRSPRYTGARGKIDFDSFVCE